MINPRSDLPPTDKIIEFLHGPPPPNNTPQTGGDNEVGQADTPGRGLELGNDVQRCIDDELKMIVFARVRLPGWAIVERTEVVGSQTLADDVAVVSQRLREAVGRASVAGGD